MGWQNAGGWRDDGWGRPAATAATTTWDPANKFQITLTNGNLTLANSVGAGNFGVVRSIASHSTGKFYCEFTFVGGSANEMTFGVCNTSQTIGAASGGGGTNNVVINLGNGDMEYNSGTILNVAAGSFSPGDIVGMAIDIGASKLWMRKNAGNWNSSPTDNPSTPSGGATIAVTGTLFLFGESQDPAVSGTLNAGGSAYAHYDATVSPTFVNW